MTGIPQLLARLGLCVVLSLSFVGFVPAAFAQTTARAKVSKSLKARLADTSVGSINVLVQGPQSEIDRLSALYGLRVVKRLEMGGVLSGTPSQLGAVVEDDNVGAMTADEVVVSTMATSTQSTGANQLWRGEDGSNYGGLVGAGVGVAIIDSGISQHPDVERRVRHRVDFTHDKSGLPDGFGHGTHVASIIAGSGGGSRSGDGSTYVGMAPGAELVSLRVLGSDGKGLVSDVILAIEWAIRNKDRFRLRVVNLSLGHATTESPESDPMAQAVERAVAAGLVVVASAGNLGKTEEGTPLVGAVVSPGNTPGALTVGALNTRGTVVRSDDLVASYSSRGPVGDPDDPSTWQIKPDLVAPGNAIVAAGTPGTHLWETFADRRVYSGGGGNYLKLSGSSMAAAVVSGAVAQVLQASPDLTPTQVKFALQFTAERLDGFGLIEQGAGSLNVPLAVALAETRDLLTAPSGVQIGGAMISAGEIAFVSATTKKSSNSITSLGATKVWSGRSVGGNTIVWGGRGVGGNTIVWGGRGVDGNTIVWGGRGVDGNTIVWGGRGVDGNTIVWGGRGVDGNTIVWGGRGVDGNTIVWGGRGVDGNTIVWGGRGVDGNTIVWGGRGVDGNTIVWGGRGVDGNTIVWGGRGVDGNTIVWGGRGVDGNTIVWGGRGVDGNTIVWGGRGVDGNTIVWGGRGVGGNTIVWGGRGVDGNTIVWGGRGVDGNTIVWGGRGVDGNTIVWGGRGVDGNTIVWGGRGVDGNTIVWGGRGVGGNTIVWGGRGVDGNTIVWGGRGVDGNTIVWGGRGVDGNTIVWGGRGVDGNTIVWGGRGVGGNTIVWGGRGVGGNTIVWGGRGVDGNTIVWGGRGVDGNTIVWGGRGVDGNTIVWGGRGVDGNTIVWGGRGVDGNTIVWGGRGVDGNTIVWGGRGVDGNTIVWGGRGVDGNTIVWGGRGVDGNTIVWGGRGVSGNTIVWGGRVTSGASFLGGQQTNSEPVRQ